MFRKQPQAFLALPFVAGADELRVAIEEALERHQVRSIDISEIAVAGSISQTIQELIRDSDFVVADLTGANSNVLFEVGMALGMGKRVVLFSRERSSDLPFNVRAQQVAVYDDVASVGKYLDLWLRDALAEQPAD